jgi:hypothetical protein
VCIQNNLNRNNTYSKKGCRGDVGGEYDCRVDGTWDQITVKGWDRNKYGQTLDAAKHFCNTHKDCVAVASSSANWNWPVHTTSKFKPCHKNIFKEVSSNVKPDLSVSHDECKEYAKGDGLSSFTGTPIDQDHRPRGCIKINTNQIWYNKNTTSTKKCNTAGNAHVACIQKGHNCDPKMNYHTKRECKKPIDGVWTKKIGGKSCEWECPGRSGVEKHTVPKFHIGKAYACSARDYAYDKNKKAHSGGDRKLTYALGGGAKGHFACRRQDNVHFSYKSYSQSDDRMTHKSSCSDWDNPAMFYKEVEVDNNEEPYKSVSEEECKAYADTHGLAFSVHDDTPSSYKRFSNGACYCGTPYGGIDGRYGSITDERRYTGGWATANGYTDEKCKNTCLNKLPESKVVQGCSRLPVSKHRSNKKDVVVYVKNAREEHIPCGSSTTGMCVQKPLTKEDFKTVSSGKPLSFYKEVSSGKNNRSVSESECKAYAQTIPGYGYTTVTNTNRPHGCYHSGKEYRYAANGNLDCGTGSDICIQKNTKNVSEQQCKAYAKLMGKSYDVVEYPNEAPEGCIIRDNVGVRYNKATCLSKCKCGETNWDCIQKPLTKEDFKTVSSGKPLSFYKEIKSGRPDMSVSEEECKAYMDSKGYGFTSEANSGPNGCSVNFKNPDAQKGFYNTISREYDCQGPDNPCIQKNPTYVSEQKCKAYAELSGKKGFKNTEWDSYPNGCFDNTTGGIYFNKGTADCATDRLCIQLK